MRQPQKSAHYCVSFIKISSFDVPDLPQIMSSLVLDTGSPGSSDHRSPSTVAHNMLSPALLEEEEEEDASNGLDRLPAATGSGRTRLSRSSKSDCLLRMNRRVSMKPQKKVTGKPNNSLSTEQDIKKFYLNNKLGSAASRNNALETIFEEPSVVRNELRMIGLKKLKRSMNFKDGLNISKTTVQSRRKKIKTLFGTTSKKFNKLSMDAFLEHLQGMREREDGEEGDGPSTSGVGVGPAPAAPPPSPVTTLNATTAAPTSTTSIC